MEELQAFTKKVFGTVRVIDDKETGKILFCAKDVADSLGYAKTRNAVSTHCRCALKRGVPHPQSPRETLEMTFIPEGDVYRLITHSRLPSAEQFEHWVFDEVLPAIRRDGYYVNRREMKQELIEELLSGYEQLQPSKASFLKKELVVSLKEQNTVLASENRRLMRALKDMEQREAQYRGTVEEVKDQLLKRLLAGESF